MSMTITDNITNAYKRHHKRFPSSIQKVITLIRTNKYDPADFNHVKMKNVAVRYGYIDNDLTIIKEVK